MENDRERIAANCSVSLSGLTSFSISSAATSAPFSAGFSGGAGWDSSCLSAALQLPFNRSLLFDKLRAQVSRHLPDEHVVLDEMPARGVEQRRVVGDRLADDAVAGLRDDDVGGAHEIFVAQSAVVQLLFGDIEQPGAGSMAARRPAARQISRRDRVVLQSRLSADVSRPATPYPPNDISTSGLPPARGGSPSARAHFVLRALRAAAR